MRVLLTGGTGRVGSRVAPLLLNRGDQVRVLVRDEARGGPLAARGAEVMSGDLRDPAALRGAVDGVDAVVHLAAATGREAGPEQMASVNRDAAVALARAALRAGAARFVFASTYFVYGPGRGRPAAEDDDLKPQGDYPNSKAAAEDALRELHRRDGLELRIMRFALVYGYGDPHLTTSMARIRTWPAHRRLHLVHHADAGQAVLRALHTEGVDGRAFNVADDAPITAAELHRLYGRPLDAEAADRPLDDPWAGIVDTTRIRAELGFRPVFPTLYTAWDAGAC
ncbi:NAD-dependent epimerase/dehydratase family protein [Actinoallomurus rhizosphaericola]|uniref:NAD-dependent epimerase/dehydratase family protein n=1 Tax=Actinoallomurus rhizosphaericola TaxID=2952536 RepID=UPI002092A3CE|nr:NAD(P)-dependent oxidoreductase [Actinoallomurus rhizosphaericola]MCO5995623.1 NAD(P)-dependent oxidoreductase [Actinoallomurus rhizosphaericola]